MSLQSEFKKFNDKIRVDFDVKQELSQKREILVDKLRSSEELPSFEILNQGSYAMCTGIEPEESQEYDIDVALKFCENKDDYEPIQLKNKICDVLRNHTDYGAKIKKPCVTVTYKKDGEAAYHVDLVTYLYNDKDNTDSQLYIAKGITGNVESQKWEKADPKGLVDYINNGVEQGEKRDQFRRVVRYLKKWKNEKFIGGGHTVPPSIGITLIAVDNFIFYKNDDLDALISIVNNIKNKFSYIGKSEKGRDLYKIELPLPYSLNFEYNNDVFEKMSESQMTDFKDKIEKLSEDLNDVKFEIDEQEQYKKLNKIFGDDFEIPQAKNSAKKQLNYIPSSSTSGME
ncbi:nucleotidyltransferase domain-containing protein [Eubacterium callanderi]|uniref:nucleotidyltransferase domain-containing protein n=1 Tax=Eubacterium callanderi TaxID=53442 RepID=UPI001C1165CC|nr:nucleotidyltransferase [Eubacterium callanderi]MBU5304829.1 nucleotidyltransferase [Eubacterium callanderi]WPK69004.1 hypothetical protein EUCA2A_31790 [Eubacterium callanderi]WPK73302.1 hypothetical protein EUCA11A_31790 [Eubacterium callanderi]